MSDDAYAFTSELDEDIDIGDEDEEEDAESDFAADSEDGM